LNKIIISIINILQIREENVNWILDFVYTHVIFKIKYRHIIYYVMYYESYKKNNTSNNNNNTNNNNRIIITLK